MHMEQPWAKKIWIAEVDEVWIPHREKNLYPMRGRTKVWVQMHVCWIKVQILGWKMLWCQDHWWYVSCCVRFRCGMNLKKHIWALNSTMTEKTFHNHTKVYILASHTMQVKRKKKLHNQRKQVIWAQHELHQPGIQVTRCQPWSWLTHTPDHWAS